MYKICRNCKSSIIHKKKKKKRLVNIYKYVKYYYDNYKVYTQELD